MPGTFRWQHVVVLAILALGVALRAPSAAAAPDQVFVDRGILQYDDAHYAEALGSFQRAIELDPEDPNARYFAGLALIALDRFEEAVTQLTRGQKLAPDDLDIAFALGVALFNLLRYDQALPLFETVAAREPERENLGFYLGVIHYQKKAYERALAELGAAKSSDPAFQQLIRFYSALANHQLGREGEATREMAQAETLRPSSPIAASARKFRDIVSAPPPAVRPFRLELRAGYQYDDDVPIAPTTNALGLRDSRLTSWGATMLARGAYDFVRRAGFTFTGLLQVYTIFNDDLPKFDIKDYKPGLEVAYRSVMAGRPLTSGLRYEFERIEQNDAVLSYRNIVQPYASYAWARWTDTTLFYRFERNDARTKPTLGLGQERLDSTNHDLGFIQGFYRGPVAFRLGYALDTAQAGGRDYTFYGQKATVGLYSILPLGFVADVTFEYHDRDYPVGNKLARTLNGLGLDRSFRQKRHDWDHSVFFALSHAIPTPASFPGTLTGSLEYFHERDVSTFALFDFERNTTSFNLVWRY